MDSPVTSDPLGIDQTKTCQVCCTLRGASRFCPKVPQRKRKERFVAGMHATVRLHLTHVCWLCLETCVITYTQLTNPVFVWEYLRLDMIGANTLLTFRHCFGFKITWQLEPWLHGILWWSNLQVHVGEPMETGSYKEPMVLCDKYIHILPLCIYICITMWCFGTILYNYVIQTIMVQIYTMWFFF